MNKGVSGNYARIAKITDKLNSIQSSLDSDRHTRAEDFERKLKELEETVWDSQEQTNRKFTDIKDALGRLTQIQEEERLAHEGLLEGISTDFAAMEEAAVELLRQAANARRDFETKVTRIIENRILGLAQDISREAKVLAEDGQHLSTIVDQNLPALDARIKHLQDERTKLSKTSSDLIQQETSRLKEEASRQVEAREESENAMLSLMREVSGQIRLDLDKEKSEREASEETLLSLLEETCKKIKDLS